MLSSGTEKDALVCNGMSNFNRNSPFANAALVVSIQHEQLFGDDMMGGMKMRRLLETRAFDSVQSAGGTKELPVQNLVSFKQKPTQERGFLHMVDRADKPNSVPILPTEGGSRIEHPPKSRRDFGG